MCICNRRNTPKYYVCNSIVSPKTLKNAEYIVEFFENGQAKVCVNDLQIIIDFANKKCSNNKNFKCYGSDVWGNDVQTEWN